MESCVKHTVRPVLASVLTCFNRPSAWRLRDAITEALNGAAEVIWIADEEAMLVGKGAACASLVNVMIVGCTIMNFD